MNGTVPTAYRYVLVSGTCLVVHNIVMIAGDSAGFAMPISLTTSFCIVVLLGFWLHSRFTFAVRGGAASLLRYTAAMATNLPLTFILLWLFAEMLRWPMIVAAPAATLILVIVNFFASRWAIGSRRPHGAEA